MAILGDLFGGFGMSRRRSRGGMWHRGHARHRGYYGRGFGRAPMPGPFGSSLGRMAMGGLAVWLARGLFNKRYHHD